MEVLDCIAFVKKKKWKIRGPEFEMRIRHNIPKNLEKTCYFTAAHRSPELFRDYMKMGSKDPKMQI